MQPPSWVRSMNNYCSMRRNRRELFFPHFLLSNGSPDLDFYAHHGKEIETSTDAILIKKKGRRKTMLRFLFWEKKGSKWMDWKWSQCLHISAMVRLLWSAEVYGVNHNCTNVVLIGPEPYPRGSYAKAMWRAEFAQVSTHAVHVYSRYVTPILVYEVPLHYLKYTFGQYFSSPVKLFHPSENHRLDTITSDVLTDMRRHRSSLKSRLWQYSSCSRGTT